MGYTPPFLDVRKVAGGWSIYPSGATTDDLTIYANLTDASAFFKLYGLANAIVSAANGYGLKIGDAAAEIFNLYDSATDAIVESLRDGIDLSLKTTGAGVVKFGTYTAGAATDSTGYITIKDSAGNTRKLMVQA